ncbi:MAG: DUF4129 domain-containing protein [Anaerolineae bacterium]|nr:DUF4129 domain-containing protein [Anaerolineae bacterium]
MAKHRKFWILVAAAIAIVALFLLSSSLSTVEFLPGKPFPWGLFMMESGEPPVYPTMGDSTLLITIVRIAILILLPLTVTYMIFTKEGRKRAVRILIQLLLFMFLMSFVVERQADLLRTSEEATTGMSPLEEAQFEPPPEFVPGDMQDLTTALSIGVALVLTVIILTTLYILWQRRRLEQDDTLLELAREAQDALDEIQTGGSLRNAVIRCYVEMSRVISEKRNIQRGITVTSHEFEENLVKAGLPQKPVQELTHLFEEARYGDQDPGPTEEQRAVACLSSIVTAVAELSR